MPTSPESTPSGPARHRPSRRTVILGAGAAAVLIAGGATAAAISSRRPAPTTPGKLVSPLLASERFTVAHHGSDLDWPEESGYAYRRSVEAGVDALEVSLARTSDGIWFGLHDATLDRTSGTKDFVAADHTWSEVLQHRITSAGTSDRAQPARPYVRFVDLLDAYGATHTFFVDPKVVDATHFDELLDLIGKHVPHPADTVIAKGYCTATAWGSFARKHGLETWGFYYGNEIEGQKNLLASTQETWSTVGLNYTATAAQWAMMQALGKTMIGHVLPSAEAARESLDRGATGLMIASLEKTLGGLPSPSPS
ncbi:glycerophosphodiester phosphodiesterase family protein [Frondihabitans australicus]|uniref:Glycerophosphoryl diester phosphodiesterase family protein n=1 Tax=Frondihabitans australicus TaxID=386892 RepID=A0A495IIJ9_9MICO|nr:glycerophosphodiester phosphodiesterase family protein [Frondihabitans australicus]RKR74926.1 glycerophosphoryl diester phosphodiesterase family protein [Frondihabitans australicus]